jgi:hypothetical protein
VDEFKDVYLGCLYSSNPRVEWDGSFTRYQVHATDVSSLFFLATMNLVRCLGEKYLSLFVAAINCMSGRCSCKF